MLEYNADMFYQTQQRFRWSYDLYRQASGAFSFPPGHESLNAADAGASLALTFTASLKALHMTHAPVELIRKNIPNILPWATHEDWWLRESAFMALMGLQEDEALFTKYLPVLTDIMAKEYNYNPHFQMIQQLRKASAKWRNDSPVGKLIIAGFARAAKESKVLPDVGELAHSREGATNMVESALALIRQAPESAAGLAELLAAGDQLKVMDTQSLK